MIIQVRAEVIFDSAIKVFNLSIALRMSRSCIGVLDIQNGEKLGLQFVNEFFAAFLVYLRWGGESVDPAVEDHLRHCGSFLVRYWHDHRNLGEGIGHAQDVSVEAR